MSAQLFKFQRPELADGYCEALQGTGILDARSGLFLAAPRRTGKSTFLREDLLPALMRHVPPPAAPTYDRADSGTRF
jgi:hypothetical protein